MKPIQQLAVFLLLLSGANAHAYTRVLSVGTNQSYDPKLETLKFAEEDARKFSLAMKTVGMVPDLRISTLVNPTTRSFREALSALSKEHVSGAGDRQKSKLIFYFSGHADENGLHFADGIIPKAELHTFLSRSKHETKIAILDSCFSGALVAKGIRKAESFDVPLLNVDEPTGSIYLTSSSSSQFAYESDALSGSVFSHHLISGMYGDGDLNKDGIVTIDELYQYVYKNTKWHALTLPHKKAQDPEMSAKLHGQGAIVLSYPVELDSQIHLPEDLSGVVSLASASGYQIFSVQKSIGEERQIRMPPGRYQFSVVDGARTAQGTLQLASHKTTHLQTKDLKWQDTTDTRRGKGAAELSASLGASFTRVASHENHHRFSAGLHSDPFDQGYGPAMSYAYGKRGQLINARSIGWFYGFRLAAFRTESGNDAKYEEFVNTAASLQALGMARIGFFEAGFGVGQMAMTQRFHGEFSKEDRRAMFPVQTHMMGVQKTLSNNKLLGLEYIHEVLQTARVADGRPSLNTHALQITYGM